LSERRQSEQDRSELWRDLDQRFRGALFAYFIRRVRDQAEAEDLTQEVFTRLTRYDNSALGKDVRAFVFVVAGNLLKDRARSMVRKLAGAHRSTDANPEIFDAERVFVEDRNPERVLMAKESLRDFVSALNGLNERTRDIFILSRIEHMQQRDIAKLFGITVSAVEKHIVKGFSFLSSRIAPP
jgi:RNA polymerase sigma factor (sigma-70 family)